MSKKGSKSRRRRETTDFANRWLHSSSSPRGFTDFLRSIEDRRVYDPEGPWRPARAFSGDRARFTVTGDVRRSNRPLKSFKYDPPVPVGVGFEIPRNVLICVRRNRRREVLHALRKTGRGGGQKPPRFNWYSKISCRR